MNDNPLQLWPTVHEQKGRRAKKENSTQMLSCSSGFPYDMNDQNYSSTQMALWNHTVPARWVQVSCQKPKSPAGVTVDGRGWQSQWFISVNSPCTTPEKQWPGRIETHCVAGSLCQNVWYWDCTTCYNCEAPDGPFLCEVLKSMRYITKWKVRPWGKYMWVEKE